MRETERSKKIDTEIDGVKRIIHQKTQTERERETDRRTCDLSDRRCEDVALFFWRVGEIKEREKTKKMPICLPLFLSLRS